MYAIVGIDKYGKPIEWHPLECVNPHMQITGISGSGKTHFTRTIIQQIVATSQTPVRIHLVDVHEDIDIPGASSLKFSSSMPYGYNPLVIDPDIHGGGPNKTITNFLKLLGKTANYKIGDRQESVLRNILVELFEKRGFFQNKPSSWRLDDGYTRRMPKKFPTVTDAMRLMEDKFNLLYLGLAPASLAALRKLSFKQKSLLSNSSKSLKAGEKIEDNPDVKKSIKELRDAMNEYCDKLLEGDGRDLENLINYPSKDLMAGVLDRLSKLHFMGIFSGDTPPFDPNASVWRYCLRSLERDESVMFVHTLAESIFRNSVKRGSTPLLRDIIVIDEAKRFQDNDPTAILNVISAESRKFGLGLILASQSHSHFSVENIRASATAVILQQDPSDFAKVKSLTNVSIEALQAIKPKQTALFKSTVSPKSVKSRNIDYETISVNSEFIAKKTGIPIEKLTPTVKYNDMVNGDPFAMQVPEHFAQSHDEQEAFVHQPVIDKPKPMNPIETSSKQVSAIEIPDLEPSSLDVFANFQMPKEDVDATKTVTQAPSASAPAADEKADLLISQHFNDDEPEPVATSNEADLGNTNDPFKTAFAQPKPAPITAKDEFLQILARTTSTQSTGSRTTEKDDSDGQGGSDNGSATQSSIKRKINLMG